MTQRSATLYRMKLPDHECPYGIAALRMLQDAGFEVDDRQLTSRDQVERFKNDHGLATTPLVFIDGQRIGGCDEVEDYLRSAHVRID